MKKILLIIFSALIITGCSESWLETTNVNSLDASSFLTTENDLQLAVNAAYTPLAQHGMFGLLYFYIQNTLDPYIWWETPNAGFDQMTFESGTIEPVWQHLYQGVFRTSDILSKMPKLKTVVSEDNYELYEAQLKALRGMYYFYLVTWFNKPIYYDETNVPSDILATFSNGTQEEFWNKLEEDLRFAAEKLPESWPASETGRITKGAANAQLGKALLFKHYHYYLRFNKQNTAEAKTNIENAKEALKRVIDSGKYHLIEPITKDKANYQAALLSNFSYLAIPAGNNTYKAENNAESVWEVQFNDDNRSAEGWLPGWQWGGNLFYYYFSPLGYRNQEIDPTLWNQFEGVSSHPAGYTKDPRAYATCFLDGDTLDWRNESGYKIPFESSKHTKTTVYSYNLFDGATPSRAIGLKKYYYPQFSGVNIAPKCAPQNVRVIRYADVLLMYAEACLQVDGDADGLGLAALNKVRARVDMPQVTELNPASIVHERDVELATEGHHYNDLIRWSFDPAFNINLTTIFKAKFISPRHLYFPIPQSEIDKNNGKLVQNPGW